MRPLPLPRYSWVAHLRILLPALPWAAVMALGSELGVAQAVVVQRSVVVVVVVVAAALKDLRWGQMQTAWAAMAGFYPRVARLLPHLITPLAVEYRRIPQYWKSAAGG